MEALYNCPSCGGVVGHAEALEVWAAKGKDLTTKLNKEADRIAKAMFDGTWDWKQKIDPKLTTLVSEHLAEGVLEGYGSNFVDLDFDSKDYKMLANLEKNVYHFSSAKNYHQLKEINAALKDSAGIVRPYPEFVKEVSKISKVYNHAWLATEYNTAHNGATLAARWLDFEENSDVMPNLQYETVGDARVRDDHAELDGVTRPISDDFWDSYYPPNGYGCRCTVNQLTSGRVTPKNDISYPDVNKMFQTNLAKQQLVFPKGHPYYDMPKRDKKVIQKEAGKITPDRSKKPKANS